MNEYEHEPIRGLPEVPPADERMIWQGEPTFGGLARRVFHVRKVALYFGLILGASLLIDFAAGEPAAVLAGSASWQLTLALASLAILCLLAWLYARSTVYTITSQRLVMRFGVALPMMVNIPWSRVDAANLLIFADGSGDISLRIAPGRRLSYWLLWPHVRPWRFAPVEPTLRSIDNAADVAAELGVILQNRLSESTQAQDPAGVEADLVARARVAGAP